MKIIGSNLAAEGVGTTAFGQPHNQGTINANYKFPWLPALSADITMQVDREECEMQEYQGGCHCGALGIIYRTDIDPLCWRLRHDGCSFCRRHGVIGTSDPAGNLSIDIEDPSKVLYYRFAHRTADFLICGECGVFVAAIADTVRGKRAVINARVLDGVALNWASVADVHFDDESPLQRSNRRSLHWTPVVR